MNVAIQQMTKKKTVSNYWGCRELTMEELLLVGGGDETAPTGVSDGDTAGEGGVDGFDGGDGVPADAGEYSSFSGGSEISVAQADANVHSVSDLASAGNTNLSCNSTQNGTTICIAGTAAAYVQTVINASGQVISQTQCTANSTWSIQGAITSFARAIGGQIGASVGGGYTCTPIR